MLRHLFNDNVKIILLVRPAVEILASLVRMRKPENVENFCDVLMDPYNNDFLHEEKKPMMLYYSLIAKKHLLEQDKKYYCLINYDELVSETEETLNKIYDFLEIPRFKHHRFNNLEQLKILGVKYNDAIKNYSHLHTIRTDKIEKNDYKILNYLPESVIEKYKNV